MNLTAIFQVLEHLDDFEIIGYGGHFVFQNETKLLTGKSVAGQDFPWAVFTPQSLRAVGVLFSRIVFGSVGGRRKKVCLGCFSETVRCR